MTITDDEYDRIQTASMDRPGLRVQVRVLSFYPDGHQLHARLVDFTRREGREQIAKIAQRAMMKGHTVLTYPLPR